MRLRSLASGGRGLENERGAVGVWARTPILLTQLSGFGAGAFADPIIDAFDELAVSKRPIQIFFEMGGMQNYESALRTRLTSHFSTHRARIASFHVFTKSRLVSMGVAVANLALGGIIISDDTLNAFQNSLDREIANAKVQGLSSAALSG